MIRNLSCGQLETFDHRQLETNHCVTEHSRKRSTSGQINQSNIFPLLNRNVSHVEQKILAYLGPKDLEAAAFVSREWYIATGNNKGKTVLLKAVATGVRALGRLHFGRSMY